MRNTDARALSTLLKDAKRVLFVTGAGISADSGLPVYRGKGGLYNDGTTEEGIPFEEALSGQMMEERPAVVWNFLRKIEVANRGASPSQAHKIIARLQNERPGRIVIFTQNIDGLHTKGGAQDVVELHGNMYRIRCAACGWMKSIESYAELDRLMMCPECRCPTRPDVVLFGEMLSYEVNRRMTDECEKGFDLGFAIGTTGSFYYIRRPLELISQSGGTVVEVNPCETDLSDLADFKMRMTASEAMQTLFE